MLTIPKLCFIYSFEPFFCWKSWF